MGGTRPFSGDRLLFPTGQGSTNDLAGASFDAIVLSGATSHNFGGARINLTGATPLIVNGNNGAFFEGEVRFASATAFIDVGLDSRPEESARFYLRPSGRMIFAGGRPTIRSKGRVELYGSVVQESPTTLVLVGAGYTLLSGTSALSGIESSVSGFGVDADAALGAPGVTTTTVLAGSILIGGGFSPARTLSQSLDLRGPDGPFAIALYTTSFSAPVQLLGPISLDGPQRFSIAGGGADLRGAISGNGRLKVSVSTPYDATLFNPANSFAGGLQVVGGNVRLGASEVIPNTGDLQIDERGSVVMGDHTETVRYLNCSGGILGMTTGRGMLRVLQPGSTLNDCHLNLDSSVMPSDGEITIIRNESGVPLVGTFARYGEGAEYTWNGVTKYFTYRGGTGYDVALSTLRIESPPPPATRSTRLIAPDGKPVTLYAFTTESSCTIASAQVIDPRAALFMPDGVPPSTLAFPHGFLDFRVDNCGVNQPVAFVVEYPDPLPPTATYWKYGPTPDNRAAHWYPMPGRVDGNRFTFTVIDGGLGDDDLTANGSIKDMGGLAFNGGTLQDLWWSGSAENGWGMSIIQHGDVLFANVYVYDSAGKPMWLVIPGGGWNAAHTAFTGDLYIPHGSPFYAYDASRFNIGAAVGSASLTFAGENNAIFHYTINGVVGRKDLTRLAFGRPEMLAAPGVGDLWWGGVSQNGWGITVLQQVRTLFSLWFTYDADGAPTWYVMPGGDWTSADTYEGRIYRAVGSAWVGATYDPTQHRTIDVESYRLRFTGDAATFDYTIDGRTGSLQLTRLAF